MGNKLSSLGRRKSSHGRLENRRPTEDGNRLQAEYLMEEGTIWHTISFKNEEDEEEYELFKKMVDEGQACTTYYPDAACDCEFMRDPNGATVLHIAVLSKKYRFAEYLIDKYGKRLVEKGYSIKGRNDELGLYTGETALHIAIVNCSHKDLRANSFKKGEDERAIKIKEARLSMIKKLLEISPNLMGLKTIGTFFSNEENKCYYGAFPLLFACSIGNTEVVQLLIENSPDGKKALWNTRDSLGNTALHMAVHHTLPKMYAFLYNKIAESIEEDFRKEKEEAKLRATSEKLMDEKLRRRELEVRLMPRNKSGLTPMTYAVHLSNEIMFDTICQLKQKQLWSFGPVTCFQIPLAEFDSVKTGGESNAHSSVIGIASQLGHSAILKQEFVLELLEKKWEKFARLQWLCTGSFYFAVMLILSFLITELRAGGRHFGYAVMGCETVLGVEANDTAAIADCEAANAVLNADVYSSNSSTRLGLEIALVLGTSVLAALDLYDACLWIAQEWKVYRSNLCEDSMKFAESRRSQVTPTLNVDATGAPDPGMTTFRTSKEGCLRRAPHKLGTLFSFTGYLVFEMFFYLVFWGIFGKIMKDNSKLRALNQQCPWSRSQGLLWSSMMWGFIGLVMFHFGLYVTGVTPWADYTQHVELSLAALLGWPQLLHYALGFKELGYLVIMIGKMLVEDVLRYLIIYFIISIAFAQALYLINFQEYAGEEDGMAMCSYCSIRNAWLSLFRFSLGDFDYVYYNHYSPSPHLVSFMFISFSVLSNILLLNLLIALMNNTYEKVALRSEEVWLKQYARFILRAERRLPKKWRNKMRLGKKGNQTIGADNTTAGEDDDLYEVYENVNKDDIMIEENDEDQAGGTMAAIAGKFGNPSRALLAARSFGDSPQQQRAGAAKKLPPLAYKSRWTLVKQNLFEPHAHY